LAFASILIACGLRGLAKPINQRTPLKEGWSLLVAALIVLLVLAALFAVFGAQIAGQFDDLRETIPPALDTLRSQLSETAYGQFLLEQFDGLTGSGGPLSDILSRVGGFSLAFFNGLLEAFLVVVAAIFFAVSPNTYRNGVLKLAPSSWRDSAGEALDASGVALQKWLLGTLISMLAIAILVGVGLWAIGVPAPLGLAVLAGLAQFVPVIGPVIAALPGILLALASDPTTALWAALVYFVASQLEANVLYPLIQERAVSQPPVITIYSIVAFGLLFGPLGVLLAVPISVVVMIFIVKFYVRDTLGEDVPLPGGDGTGRRRKRSPPHG
jgi:predicted PurR-regulated permease PerM